MTETNLLGEAITKMLKAMWKSKYWFVLQFYFNQWQKCLVVKTLKPIFSL